LFLTVAWVMASPVGDSSDEPYHIAYAWGTVTGQTIFDEGLVSTPVGPATWVRIPQKLLQYPDTNCYKFHQDKRVTQCSPIPADNRSLVTKPSNMSRYPPLFYALEGAELRAATAADLSGPRVLYGARLTAAVLSWFAVALGFFLISRRFPSHVVALATLLALPPTAWFMASSVNPNGFEIASAYLLAAAVLAIRFDNATGPRSVSAILVVPIGTLLLAWTRPLSWVWASLILAVLLVPTGRRNGGSWFRQLPVRRLGAVGGIATLLILGSSVIWFGYAFQLRSSKLGAVAPSVVWAGLNPLGRASLLLLHTGKIFSEQIGYFGWLDTPLPAFALLAWVSVTAVAAAVWVAGRSTFVPRWSLGAFLCIAYLVALLDEYRGGWGWQGRYLLPITAAVCVFAVPGLTNGLERLAALRQIVPWMMILLMGVNALSVVWFLFRNVYGVRTWPNRLPSTPLPGLTPSWTPPHGQGVVLALVALAFVGGVLAVSTLRPVRSTAEPQSSP